jgi:hypothetical protein
VPVHLRTGADDVTGKESARVPVARLGVSAVELS